MLRAIFPAKCRMAAALALAIALFPAFALPRELPLREGILLAAFGTSVPEAQKTYENIDAAYRKAFPGCPIEWAFTSRIIRDKILKSGGEAQSVPQALDKLAQAGASVIRAQSLHLLAGAEYEKFLRELEKWQTLHPGKIDIILAGRPLLDSRADGMDVAEAAIAESRRKPGTALIFMAHGNAQGLGGLALEGMGKILQEKDPHVFLASVEGEQSFEEMLDKLEKSGATHVELAPLMLVAGDHAQNDLTGPEADSWKSRLARKGFEVSRNLKGLGEIPQIAQIFISHTKNVKNPLAVE